MESPEIKTGRNPLDCSQRVCLPMIAPLATGGRSCHVEKTHIPLGVTISASGTSAISPRHWIPTPTRPQCAGGVPFTDYTRIKLPAAVPLHLRPEYDRPGSQVGMPGSTSLQRRRQLPSCEPLATPPANSARTTSSTGMNLPTMPGSTFFAISII